MGGGKIGGVNRKAKYGEREINGEIWIGRMDGVNDENALMDRRR